MDSPQYVKSLHYVKASGRILSGECPVCGRILNKHNYHLNGRNTPTTCKQPVCIRKAVAENRVCLDDPDVKKGSICEHRKYIGFQGGWVSMCTLLKRIEKGCLL